MARAPSSGANRRRSLVRTAIALLLQQPSLATHIEPPYVFVILRQPGVPLLMELLSICISRPDITMPVLLEQIEGRADFDVLTKLAMLEFPTAPEQWKAEFLDTLEQLNRQTAQQRVNDSRLVLILSALRRRSPHSQTQAGRREQTPASADPQVATGIPASRGGCQTSCRV